MNSIASDALRALAASEAPDPEALLVAAVDAVVTALHAERAFIVTLRGQELAVELARGFGGEPLLGRAELVSRTAINRVIERGEPIASSNLEDRDVTDATSVRKRHVLSILCAPLRRGDPSGGVLYLDHRFLRKAFFSVEPRRLQEVADALGRLYEAARGGAKVQPEILRAEGRHLEALVDELARGAEADVDEPYMLLIVDDQPFMRQGLAHLLDREADLRISAVADETEEALRLIEGQRPDLVLIDFSGPDTSALDLVKELKARWPDLPALVMASYSTPLHAERLLRAGARGYVTKQESTERLLAAIRKVLSGEVHVSDVIAERILRRMADGASGDHTSVDLLSDRELQVFHMIGRGLGTRQIAEELRLSIKTIETYRSHIKRKLGLKTGNELVHSAIKWSQDLTPGG